MKFAPPFHPQNTDEGKTRTFRESLNRFIADYSLFPFVPVAALLFDYAITFLLAGSSGTILRSEASPLIRFAVEHNILLFYLVGLLVLYYTFSYVLLRFLHASRYYIFAAAIILIISVTHVFAGLSWIFRNQAYSDTIIGLSLLGIIIAIISIFSERYDESIYRYIYKP